MKIRLALTTISLISILAMPAMTLAGDEPILIEGKVITLRDVVNLVQDVITVLIILASLFIVAMIVYAGFLMATSRGDDTQYKKGKQTLKYAIYGALVVFGVGLIVNTIAYFAEDPTSILE